MKLIKALQWRYATKSYKNKKVADEIVERIIKATRLSASSFGIQPYRVFVIENDELRKKLSIGSSNPQVTEASHLLVFAAFDSIEEQDIHAYLQLLAKKRGMPVESLEAFKNQLLGALMTKTAPEYHAWASKQAYIALGTAMIAAATEHVDATPMEGFDTDNFDELLGLRAARLKSVVLLAIGYRDEENDRYLNLKKVRWSTKEFVKYVK